MSAPVNCILHFGFCILNFSFYFPRRLHQFLLHAVEDAVDEAPAVLGAELFGDVHRFVDAHHRGDIVPMQHLIDRQAENVAVHGGDARQLPVLAVFADERFGKSLRGQFVGAERGQFGPLAPLGLAFVLRNGGSALRLPELRERLVEVLGRVEVMLKQKLDGAFPRLTAFAHATSIAEKRARREGKSGLGRIGNRPSSGRAACRPEPQAVLFNHEWTRIHTNLTLAHQSLPATWVLYTRHRFDWTVGQTGCSLALVGLTAALVQGGLTRVLVPRLGERKAATLFSHFIRDGAAVKVPGAAFFSSALLVILALILAVKSFHRHDGGQASATVDVQAPKPSS